MVKLRIPIDREKARPSGDMGQPGPAGLPTVSDGRPRLSDVIVFTRGSILEPIKTIFEVSIQKGKRTDLLNLFENMLGRLPYQSRVYGIHINLHGASIWHLSVGTDACWIKLLSRNVFVSRVVQAKGGNQQAGGDQQEGSDDEDDDEIITQEFTFQKDQVYQFIDNVAQVLIHNANR